jgi:hypothetical protein
MLLLALSCLQGRSTIPAALALLELGVDGLQLTPGCAPCVGFKESLTGTTYRTHHGFSWVALRKQVWSSSNELLSTPDSVHPPKSYVDLTKYPEQVFEVMYPGYYLGTGSEVELAMEQGVYLAVDISHVFIQVSSGAMSLSTWSRLKSYEKVKEIHVSANNGITDSHKPLTKDSFGLSWLADRRELPVVLECYMHRLDKSERLEQIKLIKEV